MFASSAVLLLASVMAAAPAPAEPTTVDVPDALLSITCPLELSGIVWLPSQQRYLMVSDDTGLKEKKTYHAPILISAKTLLKVDPEPVSILGLEKLDDAESIALGPDGTVLVSTSHSLDAEGHSKPARRQLLWLAPKGAAFEVKGRLDLSEVRDTRGRTLAEVVSGRPGPVDIEGMDFRAGALYLGFKAPLAEDGAATVVKLDAIAKALEAGRVAPESVEVFVRTALMVPGPDGQRVPEGVADLRFLSDGSLLLLGNAPKGGRPDGGGAAWWLKDTKGPAVMLRRFLGLKPEGITLTPDGSALAIVFDRGKETPEWVSVPLPH
jgi:hypothetical protein